MKGQPLNIYDYKEEELSFAYLNNMDKVFKD